MNPSHPPAQPGPTPSGEATPKREWYVGKHESGDYLIHTDPTSFAPPWEPREDTIGAVRGSHPQAAEFAALIVQAVNEREELIAEREQHLAALRLAIGALREHLPGTHDAYQACKRWVIRAEARASGIGEGGDK